MNYYLSIIIYISLLIISNCLQTKTKTKTRTKTETKTSALLNLLLDSKQNVEFQNYFWVQRYDATKDPVLYIRETDRFNTWEYVIVNNESIFLAASAAHLNVITSNNKFKYTT